MVEAYPVCAVSTSFTRLLCSAEKNPSSGLGVALGSGFARGLAHIGVLKVLEEEAIPVSFIAGTSIGALVGALYCSGMSATLLEGMSCNTAFAEFARWTISSAENRSTERIAIFLATIVNVRTFEDLSIPLGVVAADSSTGEPVTFRTGPLIDPLRASCAFPGMFQPVPIGGRDLIDGVFANPVPARLAREAGCRAVLAVHLKARSEPHDGPRQLLQIGRRSIASSKRTPSYWRSSSDLIIEPDVDRFRHDDFERAGDMIKSGERAMRQALPALKALVSSNFCRFSPPAHCDSSFQ
jgi:NTE family protein